MFEVTDESILPCGREHKGKKMADVPGSYLLWLAEQEWFKRQYPYILAYINKNRKLLEEEAGDERRTHSQEMGWDEEFGDVFDDIPF